MPLRSAHNCARQIARLPNDTSGFAVSFAQQRLWFLDQLEQDSPYYNQAVALRLNGSLDLELLESSINKIIWRQEALRTTVCSAADGLVQKIAPFHFHRIPIVDCLFLSADGRESEALLTIRELVRRKFNLSEGPLIRIVVLRLDSSDHILVVNAHHIIADLWSLSVFFEELSRVYYDQNSGEPTMSYVALPVRYVDFAQWQRDRLQGAVLEKLVSYWTSQLAGIPALIELPTDRPRPPVQRFRGEVQIIEFSRDLSEDLANFSRREKVTLFMTLLAVFQVLIYRYTGQQDVIIGTPSAGRTHKELEGIIGLFQNMLLLRTSVTPKQRMSELLRQVRRTTLGAYAHEDLPFERLVEILRPARTLSHNPLFQVMFTFQTIPSDTLRLPGVEVKEFFVNAETAKCDLSVYMKEVNGSMLALAEYDRDLFDSSTIARVLKHFETLARGMVSNPMSFISDLQVLTDAEREELLVRRNATEAEFPHDVMFLREFERQAERAPEAICVTYESRHISYRELNNKANQLGRYLQELGIGPESVVAVCCERSLEMMTALIGIMKSGAAYLSLDPTSPQKRLAFMMDDSGATLLLTQESLNGSFIEPRIPRIYLDSEWELISHHRVENLEIQTDGENLAYVIYTSGSTGLPKGIEISRRNLTNVLRSFNRDLDLTERDVFMSVTTVSFDIAALELFAPLMIGARLEIADHETVLSGKKLVRKALDSGCTILQATPVTWRLILETNDLVRASLKVLCGGEALSADLARQLEANSRAAWNVYGPTETTVWSTSYRLQAGEESVPIGLPIANTQVYVLDEHFQLIPHGAIGGLYIGGEGLARGYRKKPDLTGAAFVPSTFCANPGARLYKTGDAAKWSAKGNIEYIAREDRQIKIRGFRIELEEIEAVLMRQDIIRQAAVIAQEADGGNKQLVAYVVADGNHTIRSSELRRALSDHLPSYMVPATFMQLEALPLTPNNKVDRKALLSLKPNKSALGNEFEATATPIERALAGIWTEVLKLERVGANDNFFDLGGHSLLMAQAHSLTQDVFSQEFSLIKMFEYPTIRSLAAFLSGQIDEGFSADSDQEKVAVRVMVANFQREARKRHRMRAD